MADNPYSISDPRYSQWVNRAPLTGDLTGSTDPNAADAATTNDAAPVNSWSQKLFPNDIINSDIADLGKLAIGAYGATRPISSYSKPQNWTDYLNRVKELSYQGLTPEEISLATSSADRGYASDINNINNAAGGNASVVLGNYGRAAQSFYHNKANLATQDAIMHRQNLLNYGGAVGQDANMDRQIFLDKLSQEQENKKSGAALASDALYNLSNRAMYNKQYGEGSVYQNWLNAQIAESNARKQSLTDSHNKYVAGFGDNSNIVPPLEDTYAGSPYYLKMLQKVNS